MSKARICDNNIFDTVTFPDYTETYVINTYARKEINSLYQTDEITYTTDDIQYMNAFNARSPARSKVMFTKAATTYSLKCLNPSYEDMNYIALNRVVIPATARLTVYMWNTTDWNASPQDYTTGYTAKFSADNIGSATGWGTFNWGNPWAGTEPITNANPMSSTIILWFDETKYGYSLTNESDVVIPNKTVENVLHWKLEIDFENGTPGRTGTFQTDRIYTGKYLELQYNITHGHSVIYKDVAKQYRTSGGSLMSNFAPRFKELKVSFPVISPSDRTYLSDMLARVGIHKDIIFSLYPTDSNQRLEIDYTVCGKFSKIPILSERIGGYYKTTMIIRET